MSIFEDQNKGFIQPAWKIIIEGINLVLFVSALFIIHLISLILFLFQLFQIFVGDHLFLNLYFLLVLHIHLNQ